MQLCTPKWSEGWDHLLPGPPSGVEEPDEHGMRRTRTGAKLRLIQSTHEKGVVRPLDGSDLASGVGSGDPHPLLARDVLYLGRQSVRARCALHSLQGAIQRGEARAWSQLDSDRLVLERARKH